jgi:dienelactone hydrolase
MDALEAEMRGSWCVLALVPSLAVAAPEDPGPWPVGWRDIEVVDTQFGEGTFDARIYYPAVTAGEDEAADPSTGGFPLAVFTHGWISPVDNYDDLTAHLASWGFVIIMPDTHTGFFSWDTVDFGEDAQASLHWTEAQSMDATSWLAGMTNDMPWTAMGHSMGGLTVFDVVRIEPRIEVAISLQPAASEPAAAAGLADYEGAAFFISGTEDNLVSASIVMDWYDLPTQANRVLLHELQGGGHYGPMDSPGSNDTLTFDEQQMLHRRYVGAYLRAEIFGEQDLYSHLLGEGVAADPTETYVTYHDPAIWSVPDATGWTVGMAGRPGQLGRLLTSEGLGSLATPFGELGLDLSQASIITQGPLGASGVLEGTVSGVDPYFQGVCLSAPGDGVLTEVAVGQ